IESVSRYGGGNITLTFEETDMQAKRLQILTAIRQVKNELPPNIPFPSIDVGGSQDVKKPLLIYSITSTLPTNEIVEYTRQQLLPKMGLNPGIKTIALSTDSRPIVELSYDVSALASRELTLAQVQTAIRTTFFQEQIGTITSDGKTKSLFVNTTPNDIRELLQVNVSEKIKLGDIVTVKMSDLRPSYISRLNGRNAILIRLFAHEHENKPQLAAAVRKDITSLETKLPAYIDIKLSFDDTEFITKELNKVTTRAGLSIAILSVLVLLIYRRLSQLAVLMGSVIVSIGLSGLLMYLLAVPVHLSTIAGLTISFGLVIDNSIMVIDHWQRKKNLKVIAALLAATLTTVAALLVIFVLPKEERMGMDDFALAIIIALGSSVIVSLLFTP
ncbi:MAG: efflux RND transporter permease subunit, partial [Bacteroidota bacterium]